MRMRARAATSHYGREWKLNGRMRNADAWAARDGRKHKLSSGKIITATQVLHANIAISVNLRGTSQLDKAQKVIKAGLTNDATLANDVQVTRYIHLEQIEEPIMVLIVLRVPQRMTQITVATGHEEES